MALQGGGHTHTGSALLRSEQLGRNTPDPHSAGKDPKILNQRGREDWGPGIWQLLKTIVKRTLGGNQDGGDADDPVQSGRSDKDPGGGHI